MPSQQIFEKGLNAAQALDARDLLAEFRTEFLFPKGPDGQDALYFAGNSLGLQPRKVREYVLEELEDWARLGVEGHLHARHPWLPYHENLTEQTARLVGAKPEEVIVMNTLTVNLHLLMASFYRPSPKRFKILIEKGAFPSDQYAVASQARFHGYDPAEAILEISPRPGEDTFRPEDLIDQIHKDGDAVSLILIGNVNYLTGQAFDIRAITEAGHSRGCLVGFDLAHGAGNLLLNLHQDGPDFAAWCSYKYLNAGPGAIAGAFVHERHLGRVDLPRFEGWWGTNKQTRFQMTSVFDAIPTAEAWQLSNPPILQLAALRASMDLFDRATMQKLRAKSESLTHYLEVLLQDRLPSRCKIVTPQETDRRGTHLSVRIASRAAADPRETCKLLAQQGVIFDFREPDILRLAPAPLYTRYQDVYRLVDALAEHS